MAVQDRGRAKRIITLFQGKRRRSAIALMAGIVALGGLIWLIVDEAQEGSIDRRMSTSADEIITFLDLNLVPDFHQRIDKVRTFINDHSIYKMDREFWRNHGDMSAFAAGVMAHATNPLGEPVHMECSTRSNLMGRILQRLGYETRTIAIYKTHLNSHAPPGVSLASHSFLEVMNPKTGLWETQDPTYDIYWRDTDSRARISVADAAEKIDGVEPCGRTTCGWASSRKGIQQLRFYFDIISITTEGKKARYAFYTSRADLNTIYSKGSEHGTFCEIEAKRCDDGFRDIRKFRTYGANVPR